MCNSRLIGYMRVMILIALWDVTLCNIRLLPGSTGLNVVLFKWLEVFVKVWNREANGAQKCFVCVWRLQNICKSDFYDYICAPFRKKSVTLID